MSKFRIKEHKSVFTVEKEFRELVEVQVNWWKTKHEFKTYWSECSDKGYNGRFAKILPDFFTLEEAQKAIDKIIKYEESANKEPIYHEYP